MPALTPADRWPNIEVAVIQWLLTHLSGSVEVRPEADSELAPPYVLVQRVPGGTNDGLNDHATVDVDVFGHDRSEMWGLAEQVHAAMLKLAAEAPRGEFIDHVSTDMNFGLIGYGNPKLRRAVATYRITSRPQSTIPHP